MNLKQYCRSQVTKALKKGVIVRADSCAECGRKGSKKRPLIAHHDEYSIEKAHVVRWMHRPCHMSWHKKYVATVNEDGFFEQPAFVKGGRIKEIRELLGLSRKDLASRATPPVTNHVVSAWERNGVQSFRVLNIVAHALSVPEKTLLRGGALVVGSAAT
jgi:DNA-binding transcriptional regulator YiaG